MQNRIKQLRCGLALAAVMFFACADAVAGSYEDALSSATHGRITRMVELLDRGIDPDTVDGFNNSLLIIAAREGQLEIIDVLMRYRANVSHRNQAGDSALMLAVLKGHREITAKLLEGGAEVNHDGWTPLMYAAFEGRAEILESLLAAGSDVNALAPNGANALMLAARNGHINIVRRLLQTEVDLLQETDRGYSAESWALENRNTDIAALIRQAQAERQQNSVLNN